MLNIKRILVPTDYSESAERALAHASFLADWHKAELHVLHAVEKKSDTHEPVLTEEEVLEQLNVFVDEQSVAEKKPSDVVQVQKVHSSARDAIVEYAEEQDIDLIVMGSQGKGALGRLFLGSTAEGVVRLSSCPVLTVGKNGVVTPDRAIERILVPVDFSASTELGIGYARELAQTYGARIDLLHVVQEMVPALSYGHHTTDDIRESWVKAAESQLAELILHEIGYEHALATVRRGHPVTETVDYAKSENVDLIVLPSHGQSSMEQMLMGSTAEKVVRNAPCPVFVVKSFGKSLLPEKSVNEKAKAQR